MCDYCAAIIWPQRQDEEVPTQQYLESSVEQAIVDFLKEESS